MNIKHTPFKLRVLTLKRCISKAADSYGYDRMTLTDANTGWRGGTVGGGYCIVSTLLADWANTHLKDRLDTLTAGELAAAGIKLYGFTPKGHTTASGYTFKHGRIEGGIGVSSVQSILKATGIEAEETWDRSSRNGKQIGFIVGEAAEVAA